MKQSIDSSRPPNQAFDDTISLDDVVRPLIKDWKLLFFLPLLVGALAYGLSFLIPKTYLSTTTFLPPQQQTSSALASLASLSAFAGLAGGNIRSPSDQYLAMMESVTVQDRIIEHFKLRDVYEVELRIQAREQLSKATDISLGKKDGLIRVSVEDRDPQRAAAVANRYVEELQNLTTSIAVTEAQQRRAFFESQMLTIKQRLIESQLALEKTGFNAGALKAEPRAAAETYAELRAQLTAAEVRLQTLRSTLADGAPEMQQIAATVRSLRQQLTQLEVQQTGAQKSGADTDYVGRYREFKYQEMLFELMAKQYEIARLDESREGALIQVVDVAQPAEQKFKPKRSLITFASALLAGLAVAAMLVARPMLARRRQGVTSPA
ncbi:MAG: lipopolysaccharide biosynthesis protein [Proteobacteria bacterium]|nr:lipopolysaccharide biosynthesis protein [Pseudomonadota bacterium]